MRNLNLAIFLIILSVVTKTHADSFELINRGEKITITTSDLEKMPSHEIRTSTNFTPLSIFTGIRFSDLAMHYKISSSKIRAFALDDYSYTVPLQELLKYNAILAYKMNGSYIDIAELGPYVIIFPRDTHSELNTLDINAKTVWQIKTLEGLE